ncbi:hypothetical protein OPQ81_005051 [Rhizoctonia solani]|nr:hypothetical protein OPQ81_005051 [Rhizoctonia solani]
MVRITIFYSTQSLSCVIVISAHAGGESRLRDMAVHRTRGRFVNVFPFILADTWTQDLRLLLAYPWHPRDARSHTPDPMLLVLVLLGLCGDLGLAAPIKRQTNTTTGRTTVSPTSPASPSTPSGTWVWFPHSSESTSRSLSSSANTIPIVGSSTPSLASSTTSSVSLIPSATESVSPSISLGTGSPSSISQTQTQSGSTFFTLTTTLSSVSPTATSEPIPDPTPTEIPNAQVLMSCASGELNANLQPITSPVKQMFSGSVTLTDNWSVAIGGRIGIPVRGMDLSVSSGTEISQGKARTTSQSFEWEVLPGNRTALVAYARFKAHFGAMDIDFSDGRQIRITDTIYFQGMTDPAEVTRLDIGCDQDWPPWNSTTLTPDTSWASSFRDAYPNGLGAMALLLSIVILF